MNEKIREAWNWLLDEIKDFEQFYNEEEKKVLLANIDVIRPYLVIPTADEVCKAFGEYYKQQIYYLKDNYHNGFHFKDSWFIVKFEDGVVRFTVNSFIMANSLPPHLITLIGKFYEGGVKK